MPSLYTLKFLCLSTGFVVVARPRALQHHRSAALLFQRRNDIGFRANRIIKLGGITADAEFGMRVATPCWGKSEVVAHLHGELVFPVDTTPIADFHAIEESKDWSPCRLCQCQRSRFLAVAEIRGKSATKWVCCNHDAADLIHHLPELYGKLNARDIFLQATDQNMPQVRTHFRTAQKQEIVLCSQLARPETIPATIMLGDYHAVEPQALGLTNEINGTQIAIGGVPTRMDMQIQNHPALPCHGGGGGRPA